MTFFVYLYRNFGKWSALIVLLNLLNGGLTAWLIMLITRQLTGQQPLNLTPLVGLILVVIFLELSSKYLLIRLGQQTTNRLRLTIARQILTMPLARIEQITIPRLLSTLAEDIPTVTAGLIQLPTLTIGLATTFCCLAYLGWLSPPVLLVLILVGLPVVIGYQQIHRRARQFNRQMIYWRDRLFHHYRDLTEGIKELKLHYNRQRHFLEEGLERTIENTGREAIRTRIWNQVGNSWVQLAYFFFILAIIFFTRWQPLDLSILTTFAVLLLYLKNVIGATIITLPAVAEANIAFTKIESVGLQVMNEDSQPFRPELPRPGPPVHLQLTNLTYHYDDQNFQIGPLNLQFRSGELVFITGGNGSGKTTLLKLLTGLYEPNSGQIYWNDTPVTKQNQQQYQQLFSVVFADSHLFEQLFGLALEEMAPAGHYLDRLQLSHKITLQNGRFSTLNLSEGQRKRLALLVAYLEDRPIYCFDEWAASQDPSFRELFYCQLLPELKARGKLIIAISHDNSYYHLADRCLKLDWGQVQGNG